MTDPNIGQVVTLDDIDNGTSYTGTVIDVNPGLAVRVEWHDVIESEDQQSWVWIGSLRGYREE